VAALNSGLQRALVACAIFVLAAAVIGLRATNTRDQAAQPALEPVPEPAAS
jgi:hypothetical protein